MPKALVFINTRNDTSDVVKSLEKVEGVREAYSSRGMYDAVVMVQGEDFSEVREIVSKRIRSLDNVKSTLTLTLVESPT
jgi:DNA-binding Lrp family transcriptional regulator